MIVNPQGNVPAWIMDKAQALANDKGKTVHLVWSSKDHWWEMVFTLKRRAEWAYATPEKKGGDA